MTASTPKATQAGSLGLVSLTGSVFAFKFVSAVVGGAVVVLTARQLGPTGRGVLVLLVTASSFALLVVGLGINLSGRIHLVSSDHPVTSGGFLGLSCALSAIQVLVCLILGVILLPLVHVRLSVGQEMAFGLLGASMLAQYVLLDVLNAFGHLSSSALIDAGGSVTQLILVIMMIAGDQTKVTPFVIALTAGNGMQILISLAALKHFGVSILPHYRRREWILLVRSGLPAVIMGFAQVLAFRMDRYLVGAVLSPTAVGVYSVAATAPELLRLLPLSLSQPIFHRIAAGLAVPDDFRRIRILCLVVVLLSVGVAFTVAPAAVRIFFGAKFSGAATPLRILLLGEFGVAIFYFDGGALFALNETWRAAVAVIAAFLLIAVGDVMLIPPYGLAGAAWASVAAYSVMGLTAHVFLGREQKREHARTLETTRRQAIPPDASSAGG